MIKITSFEAFKAAFKQKGRENQFSTSALKVLYNYHKELEYTHFDVIGVCCEFTEYNSILEYNADNCEKLSKWEECEHVIGLSGTKGAVCLPAQLT